MRVVIEGRESAARVKSLLEQAGVPVQEVPPKLAATPYLRIAFAQSRNGTAELHGTGPAAIEFLRALQEIDADEAVVTKRRTNKENDIVILTPADERRTEAVELAAVRTVLRLVHQTVSEQIARPASGTGDPVTTLRDDVVKLAVLLKQLTDRQEQQNTAFESSLIALETAVAETAKQTAALAERLDSLAARFDRKHSDAMVAVQEVSSITRQAQVSLDAFKIVAEQGRLELERQAAGIRKYLNAPLLTRLKPIDRSVSHEAA